MQLCMYNETNIYFVRVIGVKMLANRLVSDNNSECQHREGLPYNLQYMDT